MVHLESQSTEWRWPTRRYRALQTTWIALPRPSNLVLWSQSPTRAVRETTPTTSTTIQRTKIDNDPEDYGKVLEVSSGEFDAVHANKFQVPKNLRQQLWNEAGPTIDSMMVQLTMIKDDLEDNEAGMPFEWMGVSTELRTFLDKEVRDGISAQLIHTNDMLAEMYEMNPTGVRTFDPLNNGTRQHTRCQ